MIARFTLLVAFFAAAVPPPPPLHTTQSFPQPSPNAASKTTTTSKQWKRGERFRLKPCASPPRIYTRNFAPTSSSRITFVVVIEKEKRRYREKC